MIRIRAKIGRRKRRVANQKQTRKDLRMIDYHKLWNCEITT